MLLHRTFACRLVKPGRAPDYYPRYYGLFDETYGRLTDALLSDLVKREDSTLVSVDTFRRCMSASRAT